jgi:hypothetical protein
MKFATWGSWVKWNQDLEQTLDDGQILAAGEATVAEARSRAKKAGVPSILDVVTLTDRPLLGRCWVLSHDELHHHFGSKTPPRKAIEAGQEAFLARLEPDQHVAVTAYGRGQPIAVLFAGKAAVSVPSAR